MAGSWGVNQDSCFFKLRFLNLGFSICSCPLILSGLFFSSKNFESHFGSEFDLPEDAQELDKNSKYFKFSGENEKWSFQTDIFRVFANFLNSIHLSLDILHFICSGEYCSLSNRLWNITLVYSGTVAFNLTSKWLIMSRFDSISLHFGCSVWSWELSRLLQIWKTICQNTPEAWQTYSTSIWNWQ